MFRGINHPKWTDGKFSCVMDGKTIQEFVHPLNGWMVVTTGIREKEDQQYNQARNEIRIIVVGMYKQLAHTVFRDDFD